MSKVWSDSAASYLVNTTTCPRCDARLQRPGRCDSCQADLEGPIVGEIVAASARAAEAIAARQTLIDRLPVLTPVPAPAAPIPTAPPAPNAQPAMIASGSGSSSQISVQSVLAVVGAALFAVAAIVFTFLNPDLTNFATRTTIVAVVTFVFLAGAWLLARARLQFSAEAVGALGMVFVALDIWAVSSKAPPTLSAWWFGAAATLIAAAIMFGVAWIARLRTWLWSALVGFSVVPVMIGWAVGNQWAVALGYLGVGLVALGVHQLVARLRGRFSGGLAADRGTATVIQLLSVGAVCLQFVRLPDAASADGVLPRALLLLALGVIGILSARNQLARLWSTLAGVFVAAAIAILPFAWQQSDSSWYVALIPAAAALAVGGIATLATLRPVAKYASLNRPALVAGAWSVALATGIPAVSVGLVQILSVRSGVISTQFGLVSVVGVAAVGIGTVALWAPRRRRDAADGGFDWTANALVAALWFGGLALVIFASWNGFSAATQVAVGLAIALILSLATARLPLIARRSLRWRAPFIVGAHVVVLIAAVIAWSNDLLSILGGAGVVALTVALAASVPVVVRPAHTAIGFAYALVIFAHALSLAHLETIAVLCLTTTLASLFAIAVTLLKRLGAEFWYAILGVTLVPFLIGIVSVLFQRSGWTGLSTGVTFALALTLVMTRRPGLSKYLRAFAAALLVPALAVVVICVGAQVLVVSGAPITLPIIAIIVAVALPSTPLIGAALARHGLPEVDVRYVRLWIEISALVTAALAVVLALVRAAAGFDTTSIVLLIIGIGGAVAAVTTHRRYGWVVAGASWTGALWCYWAIQGVSVLEPYILPPALAAAVIGAISVVRKLPGIALYSAGLACAIVPSVVVLALAGNGSDEFPWRSATLLVGSFLLILVGAGLTGPAETPLRVRLSTLRVPTLAAAAAAAAAGAIQAVRFGWSLDATTATPVMVPALGFGILAALLAAASGRLLTRTPVDATSRDTALARSRWLYVPAAIYLVVGPISAIRLDWFSIWSLWVLTAVLLGAMIFTAKRARTTAVTLPPVWFLFLLAWCTAVAGWSERQLRVEAFSLPLGLALLAVGVIALRADNAAPTGENGFTRWPIGFSGSWRLLTPGIIALVIPSMLATGTDPQTARAILVISIALIAILIGSLRKLAAPFLLGIIVLPIENITVFAVQVGRSIGATPWWITLATAGAVLLVIAVTYERRDSGERGVAARLRDLR